MSFRTRRIIFMTPFYMLFYFFLLKYTFMLFGGLNDMYILLLTVMLGMLHFVPMLFEAKKSRMITRFLSTLYGVWIWAAVMLLIDIIAIYLLGFFVDLPNMVIFLMLSIIPILGIYNYYRAHRLIIHEKTLTFDNLESDIYIAHLSDVHFGSVRHIQIIELISDKLKSIEKDCDIAIISGDLADGSSVVNENDFMALNEVDMPIIFTPGNHDYYPGLDNVIKACKKAGIIVLNNDNYEFKNLNIFGLSYSFGDIEMPSENEIRNSIIPDKINIINYHVPYNWSEFSSMGFDIQLSGHTHGGQFYPVVWFGNKMFDYNMGLFKNGLGKYIHVTTGVGSMDTPMRWGTDSEIVILKLKRK